MANNELQTCRTITRRQALSIVGAASAGFVAALGGTTAKDPIATSVPESLPTSPSPPPQTTTVRVNTKVVWFNSELLGGPNHEVTSGVAGIPDGKFASGRIEPGGTFEFTFTEIGRYPYFSTTDPKGLSGEIIVTP